MGQVPSHTRDNAHQSDAAEEAICVLVMNRHLSHKRSHGVVTWSKMSCRKFMFPSLENRLSKTCPLLNTSAGERSKPSVGLLLPLRAPRQGNQRAFEQHHVQGTCTCFAPGKVPCFRCLRTRLRQPHPAGHVPKQDAETLLFFLFSATEWQLKLHFAGHRFTDLFLLSRVFLLRLSCFCIHLQLHPAPSASVVRSCSVP